ncbi:PREDICTED: uncharacterized protein LOC108558493 [Nicrophorus vespilloides]|uniref:Uncharacterized protein LOC108558493 n=1 Tax=Nicrophorus vespilloides TaxID=110193 RepID=A0ABM1M8J8_NICVS|nr:PREDICTED: uncharacterized protein LOC108558493 [Nicrophorus vespilloides]
MEWTKVCLKNENETRDRRSLETELFKLRPIIHRGFGRLALKINQDKRRDANIEIVGSHLAPYFSISLGLSSFVSPIEGESGGVRADKAATLRVRARGTARALNVAASPQQKNRRLHATHDDQDQGEDDLFDKFSNPLR